MDHQVAQDCQVRNARVMTLNGDIQVLLHVVYEAIEWLLLPERRGWYSWLGESWREASNGH